MTLDHLHSTVTEHGQRISSLEDNSNEVDLRLQELETACSTLQQNNVLLKTKVRGPAGAKTLGLSPYLNRLKGHDQPRSFLNYLLMALVRRSSLPHLSLIVPIRALHPSLLQEISHGLSSNASTSSKLRTCSSARLVAGVICSTRSTRSDSTKTPSETY